MGTEGGDKCVDNVDKLRKKWWGGEKGTNPEEVCNTTGRQRGQGNFELAANFGYNKLSLCLMPQELSYPVRFLLP